MDFALLIPLAAMAIPITAVIMAGKRKIAELSLEETRLRLQGGGEGVGEDIEELREEVAILRGEMSEVQERLDFTERLLSQAREHNKLSPGSADE